MNLNEIGKQYNVSLALLHQFIEAGILANIRQVSDEDIFKDEEIKRLEMSICLSSLGFDVKTIKRYIFLEQSDQDVSKEKIKILCSHRENILKNIHKTKNTMDCIDSVLQVLQTKDGTKSN